MEKSEIWGCGGVSNFSGARGASGIECSIAHFLIRKESHVCLARVLLLPWKAWLQWQLYRKVPFSKDGGEAAPPHTSPS